MAEKERRRAVGIVVRLGSTLIAKIGPRISTALIRKDIYETDLDYVDFVVVTEDFEWFLIWPLTLLRWLSATIMPFCRSWTHPVDCHVRVRRRVKCSKRRWKKSSGCGHDG